MFISVLTFGENRAAASEHMAGHNAWISKGFEDGAFLFVGSLAAGGGTIIARGETRADHDARLAQDPFVVHKVVEVETHEVTAKLTVPALDFLKASA